MHLILCWERSLFTWVDGGRRSGSSQTAMHMVAESYTIGRREKIGYMYCMQVDYMCIIICVPPSTLLPYMAWYVSLLGVTEICVLLYINILP